MTLLAALASGVAAQQAQRLGKPEGQDNKAKVELAPVRIDVRPSQVEWREIQALQGKLPRSHEEAQELASFERAVLSTSQPEEDLVLPTPSVQPRAAQPDVSTPQGDIQRLGNCTGFPVIPPASLSTIGQTDGPDSFATLYYPPNAAGSVGPNHLMVMAPNFTLIQDRLGASVASVDTITFWSPTGAPSVRYCRLEYSAVVGRWLATAQGGTGVGACSILFAISDSDDPTGGWDFYSIPADPTLAPPTFPDGLKMGHNATWVAVTADMYSTTVAGGNQGSRLYTFDMAAALLGGPVTANIFPSTFVTAVTGQAAPGVVNWRNIVTRDLDGSLADMYILNCRLATATSPLFQQMRITGTGAAPTVLPRTDSLFAPPAISSLFFIPVDYTNSRQAVFQVGDVRLIDPLQPDGTFASTRARLADAVVRNGKIWIVQNHGLPGPAAAPATQNGIGFYEFDPAGGINQTTGVGPFNQQAQITTGINTSLVYPSVAVNCAEDVLIGFTRADATRDLEAAYCMRLGTDALGTMGPVTTLKAGESSWWQLNPPPNASALGAWGYYSSSTVDPNDDTTLWTLQPYAATRVGALDADSRWGTWWGRLGDCEILPVITDHPDDLNACIGDPVSFTVVATTGSNPLQYQWRLNGNDILGANSATLFIPSAVASDEGVYDCVVCGCGMEISQPATLEFDEPTILVQPDDYTAALGDPAAFFIVASPSLGSLSYQWFHEGNPVGIDDDILALGPVTGADYGDYTCLVTDGCGTILSTVARLLPENKASKAKPGELSFQIFEHPASQLACVGSTAVLSVQASPDSVTYVWRFNGSPIVPPETNPTLVLNPVSLVNDGIYDVVVTNGANSKTSLPAALDVIDLPVVTVQPSPTNVSVSPGNDVFWSVTATGGGTLSYQWQKRPQSGGGAVQFSNIPGATNTTLGLADVTSADNGTYRCRITNQCGTISTINVRLTVL